MIKLILVLQLSNRRQIFAIEMKSVDNLPPNELGQTREHEPGKDYKKNFPIQLANGSLTDVKSQDVFYFSPQLNVEYNRSANR